MGGDQGLVSGPASLAARASRWLHLTSGGDIRQDVERGIVGMFVIVRLSNLVTITLGAPAALITARNPAVFVAITTAASMFVVAECVALWRTGKFPASPWGWTDVAIALVSLVVVAPLFAPAEQTGTWAVWAPGFAVATASGVGIWAADRRRVLALAALLGVAYLAVMIVYSTASVWTIAANVATYPAFALIASWASGHLRRVASQAVEAQEAALVATARLELERYQLLVHDATGVLRLLGDEETPEVMRRALRKQALAEAVRLRTYLADDARAKPAMGAESAKRLPDVVTAAVDGFEDLAIELALDLGREIHLHEVDALVLERAIVTVLHNVRRHARAQSVVVHTDADAGTWELTIRDDGVGFTRVPDQPGFGLATQVEAEVTRRGMRVEIESAPGEGTAVVFRGDRRRTAPGGNAGGVRSPGGGNLVDGFERT